MAIHYVSNSGTDTWANSTNIVTPCSVATAMANVAAGDMVYFRGGTYEVGQSVNYESPVYVPTNSGTNGNPITFKAYLGETSIINATIAPVIISGTADADTTQSELHDDGVDFVVLGVIAGDLVRTTNTTKGGGWVATVAQHILTIDASHNYLDASFGPGDTYDILHHSYDIVVSFGTVGQSYIIYDGFTFTATDNELNGVAFIDAGTGNQLLNCIFTGGSKKVCHGDNRQFIMLTSQSYPKISRNKIYGLHHMIDKYGSYGQIHNTGGYKSYSVDHAEITNNEVYDCTGGFYFKTNTDDSTIAYNFVHDNGFGISMNAYVGSQVWSNTGNSFYHNVVVNNSYSNLALINETGANNNNTQVYNNTIYGGDHVVGMFYSEGEFKIWNNIVDGCSAASSGSAVTKLGMTPDMFTKNLTECDYNNWGTVTDGHVWTVWWYDPAWKHADSFVEWQAAEVIDPGGGYPDVHGISVDPLFVNGSGNLNLLGDFRLQAGSPCKGTGKTGIDMGANIGYVGLLGTTGSAQDHRILTPNLNPKFGGCGIRKY